MGSWDLVIIGKPTGWHVQQLVAAGARLGLRQGVVPFDRLTAGLGPDGSTLTADGIDLMHATSVLVRGIPAGPLEPIVFRMDGLYRLAAAGVRVINSPKAIEACVDKYLATARLASAGLPVPRTLVCERAEDALAAFEHLGGDVVLKPLFGSEGRGILRLDNAAVAERVFRSLAAVGAVLYLQEFVPHPGYDVRALVIDGRVLAAMRRRSNGDFRTNVAQGGSFERCALPEEWSALAIAAANAVGAGVAGVDLLPDATGRPLVVEVNSNPGFKALVQVADADIPAAIVQFAIKRHRPA